MTGQSRKKYVWYHSRDGNGDIILSRTAWLDLPKRIRTSPEMIDCLVHGRIRVIEDRYLDQRDPRNLFSDDPINSPPDGDDE